MRDRCARPETSLTIYSQGHRQGPEWELDSRNNRSRRQTHEERPAVRHVARYQPGTPVLFSSFIVEINPLNCPSTERLREGTVHCLTNVEFTASAHFQFFHQSLEIVAGGNDTSVAPVRSLAVDVKS